MKRVAMAALAMALLFSSGHACAQKDPDVGNVQMSHKKSLLDNLATSPIHTRLLQAIRASGLADTFSNSTERITLFAPTDDAFAKLPAGTLTNLLKPENQEQLKQLVLEHVVDGRLSAKRLAKLVKKAKGPASIATRVGTTLQLKRSGTILTLTDAGGDTAVITTADVGAKKSTMHVIDTVLRPR